MYKKLQSFVALVLCLSCTFFTLSLNTLHVRASAVNSISDIVDFLHPVYQSGNTTTSFRMGPTMFPTATSIYRHDFDIVISPNTDTSSIDIDPYKTYCVLMSTNGSGCSVQFTAYNSATLYNNKIYGSTLEYKSITGRPLTRLQNSGNYIYRGYALVQGIELLNGYSTSVNKTCNFQCVASIECQINYNGAYDERNYFTITLPYNLEILPLKEDYQYMNTTDMETIRQIQQSENVIDNRLQNSTSQIDNTLIEGNEIADDTNETTHGILDSITSFFGSFFNNLIGVFVPEDGYFTTWFNRLNTLLTDKLGILYFPFSYFIDLMTEIYTNASGGTQGRLDIVFPEIAFTNVATGERYVFLSEQTVNLRDYDMNFSSSPNSPLIGANTSTNNLVRMIRRFNNCIFVFALIKLLYAKLSLIMRGHENDN